MRSLPTTPRIPAESVDPTAKNFHWGDLTRANFEAHEQGAETAILLDLAGFVTEGPGFNVFAVTNGVVVSPPRGALEGVTRLSVLELCEDLGAPFEVRPIPRAEIEERGRNLLLDDGRRRHAGQPPRRPHSGQWPAGADLVEAAPSLLG